MVVANDVKNIDDMLLIPAGSVLTERQTKILQAWGVAEVEVRNSDAISGTDPLSRLSSAQTAMAQEEIKNRFWSPDESNPVYREIFKLMLCRRAVKILGG